MLFASTDSRANRVVLASGSFSVISTQPAALNFSHYPGATWN